MVGDSRVPWDYEYERIAHYLLTTGQYAYDFYGLTPASPTAFVPPLYPLLLALAGWVQLAWALKVTQIALSLGTVLCVYALARALRARENEALLAALLAAIYPPLAAYAVSISTVTLEAFFLVLGSWLLLRTGGRAPTWAAVGAGAALAAAGLTRSTWLILLPLALVWIVWYPARESGAATRIRLGLALALGAAILCLPWAIRNQRIFDVWSVSSTNGGLNFWIGNHPKAAGEYVFPLELDRPLAVRGAELPEFERDRFFYAQGWQAIAADPGHAVGQYGLKLLYYLFFRPNIGSNYAQADLPLDLAKTLFIVAWLASLPFAVYGLTKLSHAWREHSWLALAFMVQALLAAAFFVGTRFRTPLDPFVLIWTAIGMLAVWRRLCGVRVTP